MSRLTDAWSEQGDEDVSQEVGVEGLLRDKRFNAILNQGLGKVVEILAKRLLIVEGFIVKDFSFSSRESSRGYQSISYFQRRS